MTTRMPGDGTDRLARELLAGGARGDAAGEPAPEAVADVRRQLDAVREVLRSDAADAPSEGALRRAEAIFPVPSARAGRPLAERLRAVLIFDSRTATPGLGLRGGAAATMVRYEAGDLLVDLEVRPSAGAGADSVDVVGQIDGGPGGKVLVELLDTAGEVAAAGAQDELGAFRLTVPAGVYDLVARVGRLEVVVPGVELR